MQSFLANSLNIYETKMVTFFDIFLSHPVVNLYVEK